MRRSISTWAVGLTILLGFVLGFAPDASAQIYKYKKGDGSVVYTDNLSQLPEDRRTYYARVEQERERQRQEQIRNLGKEEFERQEKEKELAALERQQLDEAERARRTTAINAVLEELRARRQERDASQANWQLKTQDARKKVADLLADFNTTQESYQTLAIKPSFTLLPGQQAEQAALKKKLDGLEKDLDAAIEYLDVGLPEEARKAGVPPGWIR